MSALARHNDITIKGVHGVHFLLARHNLDHENILGLGGTSALCTQ
jgi:hypothetical protein